MSSTMLQVIHYLLHISLPVIAARLLFHKTWSVSLLFAFATMIIDLDHLLATPVFDASRCSIGFHPLHSYAAISVYVLLLMPLKSRMAAVGLLLHILVDGIDCLLKEI